jgi:N-acetylmuramoyl-L-alanine amidase
VNRSLIPLGLTLLFLSNASGAFGAVVTFRATGDNGPIDVTAAVYHKESGDYVSLNSVCAQIGAACAVQPTRLQIDFHGKSCWVRTNDKQVNASLSTFSLEKPVLRQAEDALVSVGDVGPFFQKAFGLAMSKTTARSAEEPANTDPSRLDDEPPLSEIEVPASDRLALDSIVIDPGHGGSDAGASGQTVKEKDLALVFAETLKKELESTLKLTVVLTRQDDKALSMVERADIANRSEGDLFISIHSGASNSPNASGFELFYSTPAGSLRVDRSGVADSRVASLRRTAKSKAIAQALETAMVKAADSRARGTHEAPIRQFNSLSMPGVLIELGCLTNTGEEALLQTEAYRNKLAKAIASGIDAYIKGGAGQ